jgi:hypothetical protein
MVHGRKLPLCANSRNSHPSPPPFSTGGGFETLVHMQSSARFATAIEQYAVLRHVQSAQVRIFYRGVRVPESVSPAQLGLEARRASAASVSASTSTVATTTSALPITNLPHLVSIPRFRVVIAPLSLADATPNVATAALARAARLHSVTVDGRSTDQPRRRARLPKQQQQQLLDAEQLRQQAATQSVVTAATHLATATVVAALAQQVRTLFRESDLFLLLVECTRTDNCQAHLVLAASSVLGVASVAWFWCKLFAARVYLACDQVYLTPCFL